MLNKIIVVVCIAVAALSANAAPVTLQSTWSVRDSSSFQTVGLGTLLFTYDDQTPDTNPDPRYGEYANPLISASFSFNDLTFTLDNSSPTSIFIDAHVCCGVTIAIDAYMLNAGQLARMSLPIELNSYLTNDSLSVIEGKMRVEGASFLTPGYILSQQTPFSAVPLPGGALLFSSSLAFFSLRRRVWFKYTHAESPHQARRYSVAR